jgi:uncharacterized membrane protein
MTVIKILSDLTSRPMKGFFAKLPKKKKKKIDNLMRLGVIGGNLWGYLFIFFF